MAIFSPDKSRDPLYLSNYATLQIKDELARLPGVGDLTIFGARDYSMRLWLNPEQLASRNLTTGDFITATKVSNVEVSGSGSIDGQGAPWWAAYNANNAVVTAATPAQPGDLVVLYATGLGATQPLPVSG